MATVKVMFLDPAQMITMYRGMDKQLPTTQANLAAGYYTEEALIEVEATDIEAAADEVFDLTNNPSRQDEREEKYGNGRSLSVGDIVVLGDDKVVCLSFGWAKV